MILLLPLLTQAAPIAAAPASRAPGPVIAPARCTGGVDADGEIIVCGRVDQEQFRMRPLADAYRPNTGPGIGFMLGDVAGNVYAAQEKTIDGKPDKRIMVTLKKPF